jgi:hypothetical protein
MMMTRAAPWGYNRTQARQRVSTTALNWLHSTNRGTHCTTAPSASSGSTMSTSTWGRGSCKVAAITSR